MSRGRLPRGLASAAAVLAIVAPAALLPAATGAVAAPRTNGPSANEAQKKKPQAEDPTGPPPVQVRLAELAPAAPKNADTLTVRGTLHNAGTEAVEGVSVRLRVSTRPLANRSEVASVAAGEADVRETAPVAGAEQQVTPSLPAGTDAPWALAVPVKSLRLPGNGVYVLQVEVRAGDGAAVGVLTSFLPFLPKKKLYDPTRVSWLWPLAAEPSRDARGAFTDDSLARELAPGGRLAELAEAPGRVPVTWMVDPELLESAAALARQEGHSVRDGKKVRTQPADANAARWLATLRQQLAGKPVGALPYADPDVAGLARHDAADRITAALARSRTVTTNVLGRTSDTALAWPPDALADAPTLGALRAAGATAVVLSSATVVPTAALSYTPTGRATVDADGARMQALLADAGLSGALAGDLAAPGAAQLAAQRFLADTAMLTLERPNEQRTVLVTPPRRWSPPADWAQALLAASGSVPWLQTVGLATMSRTVEAPQFAGATLVYPATAKPLELGAPFLGRVRAAAASAESVVAVLASPGALGLAYQAAVLRSASSVWRDDRARGRAYVEGVWTALREDAGRVRVIGRSLVTLSSNHGTVPITVSNGLNQAVRVRLVLTPTVASRLRMTSPAEAVLIGPGRKQTVRVGAEASTNGITRVAVALQSPAGHAFGAPTELRVNTTSYGNVGLMVVGSAVGVLFLAAGARNVRRIRTARAGGDPGKHAAGEPPSLPVDEKVQA